MNQISSLLFTCISISVSLQLNAQTTLAAGDIMIIGWNADKTNTNTGAAWPSGDNDICFLLLKDISSGTDVYFTDLGWTGSGFQSNGNGSCVASGAQSDGCIRWTAGPGLTAGAQVRIGCCYGLVASSGTVTSVLSSPSTAPGGPSSSSPGHMSLSIGSDEIYAFQSSNSGAPLSGTITLIAGVHYGNNWVATLTQCQTVSTQSTDPGSSVGGYAFLWSTASPDDNAYYSGSKSGNVSTLRTNILNTSNWTVNDATANTFPIAGSFSVLPVQLISFSGKSIPSGQYLEWEVENEEHFFRYEVENSSDGRQFGLAGIVPASGKSRYSYTAQSVADKYQFYRLKMVDIDGRFTYSNILRLPGKDSRQELIIYPNPANGIVNISSKETIITLIVTNAIGKKCLQQNGNGMQTATLDLHSLAPGSYLISVITKDGIQTERIANLWQN